MLDLFTDRADRDAFINFALNHRDAHLAVVSDRAQVLDETRRDLLERLGAFVERAYRTSLRLANGTRIDFIHSDVSGALRGLALHAAWLYGDWGWRVHRLLKLVDELRAAASRTPLRVASRGSVAP